MISLILLVVEDPSAGDLISILTNASGPTLLAIIVVGAIREWWIPGKTHKRTIEERDRLMELLMRSTVATDKALVATDKVLTVVKRENDVS